MDYIFLIYIPFLILLIGSVWVVFEKAGKPGWAAIIPIYSMIVFIRISGKSMWYLLFLLIPVVNIIFSILLYIAFVERFGKGVGYVIGLWFLPIIFFPILAFGNSRYQHIYYINDNAQNDGEHELHTGNCSYLHLIKSKKYLGSFSTCEEAMTAAHEHYDNVGGCKYCSPKCDR